MVYLNKHHPGVVKAPKLSGLYADVTCPDCGNVGPAHSVVGEKCPAEVYKSLARMARSGNSDAVLALFKAVGSDRAAQLLNPYYQGGL